jgi:hypothetical protein
VQAGEDTAADGDNPRTKGVLHLERPADETADDTHRLAIPPPRRPQDDEPATEPQNDEPTTRL